MVAAALPNTPPNEPGRPRTRERDFAMVPHEVVTRSQRQDGGGFTQSARALQLYARIRKHCLAQTRKLGGTACDVSVATLAAAIGVKIRQTRNLRRQLVAQGFIRVDWECSVHGVNRYHLVLPAPAAREQLLPGRPARHPGPHYVVTPATRPPVTPRQNFAAALDVGVRSSLGVEVALDPTPERRSGAASSGAALSAADTPPAAPVPPPSGRAGKPTPAAASGGATPTAAPRAVEEGGASGVPSKTGGDVVRPPADCGKLVELWPKDEDAQRAVLTRFLRREYPSITANVVEKTLDAWRNKRIDAECGGDRVRSHWRFCAKVAKRILAADANRPAPVVGKPVVHHEGPRHVTSLPPDPGVIDPCVHGLRLDEDCPTCDHRAPVAFLRAVRRQQVKPGPGTNIANKVWEREERAPSPERDDVKRLAPGPGPRSSSEVVNNTSGTSPGGAPTTGRRVQLRSVPSEAPGPRRQPGLPGGGPGTPPDGRGA